MTIAKTNDASEPGSNGLFTVTLSNASSTDTVVNFGVSGTAVSGTDFTALSGTVTILAGATTATISVPVIDDSLVEGDETVIVTLTGVSGDPQISLGTTLVDTVTISDNDTATVSIAKTSDASEPGSNGLFTVTLSNASSTDTVVNFGVSGTAVSGTDFTALSGTVTILAGATTATISVPVIDDSLVEGDETVIVTLTGVSGDPQISLGTTLVDTVTISDNDTATVSIAKTSDASEPGSNGLFTVTLSNASSTDTVVNFGVSGTATSGTDFTALSGTVTILAGATTATISVPVIDDSLVEGDETVIVTLTGVSGDPQISLGTTVADTVTISDNDSCHGDHRQNQRRLRAWKQRVVYGDLEQRQFHRHGGELWGERHGGVRNRLYRAERHGDDPGGSHHGHDQCAGD